MRKMFWIIAVIGLLASVFGIAAPIPLSPDVPGDELAEWFRTTAFISALIGLLIGAGGSMLTQKRLHHRPREAAREFLDRVALWGVVTQITALAAAFIVALYRAAMLPLGPLAPGDRVALLLVAGRALLPLGLAIVFASLAFVLVTYARTWGGQYALAPWIRKISG